MNRAELLLAWLMYKRERAEKQIRKKQEGAYTSFSAAIKYKVILEALILWKFIQKIPTWKKEKQPNRSELNAFLSYFLMSVNPFVRLIAMIEILPTTAWRVILWKYNIDFTSFESMLRRIQPEQMQAIAENYNDFVSGKLPRACKKVFGKKITYKSLLVEFERNVDDEDALKSDIELRYSTKGAMSYNLFGLDFGFNAYPKGSNDDTKVIEKSPFKFLSVKDHADDFIVNQESGKYWWLYRTVRSSLGYRPTRQVELKTHICPGFWYTFVMHLIFWIISPVLCLLQATSVIDIIPQFDAPLIKIIGQFVLLLPTILTPFWLISALVYGSFLQFDKLLKKMPDSLVERFDGTFKDYFFSIGIGILTIVVTGLAIGVSAMLSGILNNLTTQEGLVYNIIRFVALISICCLLVVRAFEIEKNKLRLRSWCWYPDETKSNITKMVIVYLGTLVVQFFMIIIEVLWIALRAIANFAVLIANFIAIAAVYFYDALLLFIGTLGLYSLVLLIGFGLPLYLIVLADKLSNPLKYPRLAPFVIKRMPLIAMILIIAGIGYQIAEVLKMDATGSFRSMIALMFIGYLLILLAMVIITKRSMYKYDKRIEDWIEIFDKHTELTKWGISSAACAYSIIANKFLNSGDKIRKARVAGILINAISDMSLMSWSAFLLVHKKPDTTGILHRLFDYVNSQTILDKLADTSEIRKNAEAFYKGSFVYYVRVYEMRDFLELLNNMSLLEAMEKIKQQREDIYIQKIREEREIKQRRQEKFDSIWGKIKFPFFKIKEFFSTLYGIYDWFNNRCPYVARSKTISLK